MFKFLASPDPKDIKDKEEVPINLRDFEEIEFNKELHPALAKHVPSTLLGKSGVIGLVISKLLEFPFLSQEDELRSLLSTTSDLIPGTYEGGFKVWECSFDLIDYLTGIDLKFSNLKVLDVGCGSGILGIFALLREAPTVHFHDYNREVLNFLTIPNVLLNSKKEEIDPTLGNIKAKYYSGDWSAFAEQFHPEENNKYDLILTSETIYNLSSCPKLVHLIKTVLKHKGILFLAAKSFYFGVGGGTRDFLNLIEKDGGLQAQVAATIKGGVQREIIKITFKI